MNSVRVFFIFWTLGDPKEFALNNSFAPLPWHDSVLIMHHSNIPFDIPCSDITYRNCENQPQTSDTIIEPKWFSVDP